ncbi:5'-methylthioadenosine/adenosylhomocysteine nucleosidase [Flavobacteriaceae bacterium Ap0902]|nr:5'-methylthioadenosine/adenosylhomocysteine nucleosidase [Flavobacteriaceae bacterium Ap0902]
MIGIMSAMQEEIQALINQLENKESYRKGKRAYHTGTLFGMEVALVFSRWGKVASATTATQLINDFNLDELIFTGVAGAITPNLNIGDIVIGNQLVQYDMNAHPLFDTFEIPLLGKTFFDTNKENRDKLYNGSQLFLEHYNDIISDDLAEKINITKPKSILGDIASADQFVHQASQVQFIIDNLNSVACVEMEGAAVAQVCYEYNIPFSIMRIISDNANDNAHIDFPFFAKEIASKYALEVLRNYFQ